MSPDEEVVASEAVASEPAPEPPRAGTHARARRRLDWWERHLSDRRWHAYVAIAVIGLVSTVLLLPLARTEGEVGPAVVSLGLGVGRHGSTVLEVPPLGRVVVDSHHTPVLVTARVESLDLRATAALADRPDLPTVLQHEARNALLSLVLRLAVRVLAVAVLAGLVVGLLVPGRSWRHAVFGVAVTLVPALVLLGATWATYATTPFRSPRFEGALERAPEALDAIEREYTDLQGLRDRMSILASQLTILSAQAAAPGSVVPGPDDVRILHVSDIHLNPIGLEIARNLAEQFDVDAIVDTGDLTSFGLPYESEIGRLISTMPVPYYFVPGNHDSPSNRRRLATVPNLRLLDRTVASIRGVLVLGVPDPATSVAPDEDGVSGPEARAARLEAAPAVAELVRRDHPDVLAVAGLALAEDAVGSVPLVISGDVHERTSEERDGTLLLTVGTTGAGGVGRLTRETGTPYAAQILRFRAGRLVALDYVTLDGLGGGFTVDRVMYGADAAPTPTG